MQFGVFDHVDATGRELKHFYEERLRLTESYDRLGFYCYHVAEHHFTPLGLAPSPGIFLSAVAQRTRRIRLGPCVYLLSIYHPLRILEEVCMLDHLSGGRFQLGVGRGVSPFELGYYGVSDAESSERYIEAYQVLMQGLQGGTLTHKGKHFDFRDVPLALHPLQRPHPPLWYGMGTAEAAAFCAESGFNTLSIGFDPHIRGLTDRYREVWTGRGRDLADLPLLGMSRHVVVADTDQEARRIARRAYPLWQKHLAFLWRRHGASMKRLEAVYPADWDEAEAREVVVAGPPARVRDYVRDHAARAGVNYFVGWFSFGDMTVAEATRSAELFAGSVMPELADPGLG